MSNFKYYIFSILSVGFLLFSPIYGLQAQINMNEPRPIDVIDAKTGKQMNDQVIALGNRSGLTVRSIGQTAATVVWVALGLLGVIFLALIIMAGFKWMTAGGNDEQIKSATNTIKAATIGLIIVVLAYSITYFIFRRLP